VKSGQILFCFSFLLFLHGCGGVNTYEQKDCVSPVEFESTENIRITSVKVSDQNYSYSYLTRNQNDMFIEVIDPLDGGFDVISKYKDGTQWGTEEELHTVLPRRVRFRLTGTVRRTSPWGIYTIGGSGMHYFEARELITIDGNARCNPQTYWIADYELSLLTQYAVESPMNVASAKAIGVGVYGDQDHSLGVKRNWQCSQGERESIKIR